MARERFTLVPNDAQTLHAPSFYVTKGELRFRALQLESDLKELRGVLEKNLTRLRYVENLQEEEEQTTRVHSNNEITNQPKTLAAAAAQARRLDDDNRICPICFTSAHVCGTMFMLRCYHLVCKTCWTELL